MARISNVAGLEAELRRQHDVVCEQARTHVAATFIAGGLNAIDITLLETLDRTRLAWEAVAVPTDTHTPAGSPEDEAESVNLLHPDLTKLGFVSKDDVDSIRAVQEAARLERWLLADEWLSLHARQIRRVSTDDDMSQRIALRRVCVAENALKLNELLDKRRDEVRALMTGPGTDGSIAKGAILHRLKALRDDLDELLRLLHGALGPGAAMNNRCD